MLVSAFAFGGVPAQAPRTVLRDADLYVSPELLAEYREVLEQLRSSGKVTAGQHRALVSGSGGGRTSGGSLEASRPLSLSRG